MLTLIDKAQTGNVVVQISKETEATETKAACFVPQNHPDSATFNFSSNPTHQRKTEDAESGLKAHRSGAGDNKHASFLCADRLIWLSDKTQLHGL